MRASAISPPRIDRLTERIRSEHAIDLIPQIDALDHPTRRATLQDSGPSKRGEATREGRLLQARRRHAVGYKHVQGRQEQLLQRDVVAMIWRFLPDHEPLPARRCDVDRFSVVTTVPSGSAKRDEAHPLRRIVGEYVGQTRDRYKPLLRRRDVDVLPRTVDPATYDSQRRLYGEHVLLIDDIWTTGSSVQSAAVALVQAGAGRVGVVVAGRHLHDDRDDNAERLRDFATVRLDHLCLHHQTLP